MSISDRVAMPLRRVDSVFAAPVGNQLLLMSVDAGKYFDLNAVGARIWELLDQPRTVDDLVSTLTAEYEVADDVASHEVVTFVDALRARGLVTSAAYSGSRPCRADPAIRSTRSIL